MESETRRRALRAVAKVAFGAAFAGTLPGCGGRAQTDFNGPVGDGGSGGASSDASSGSALVDAGATHAASGAGPSSTVADAGPATAVAAGGAGGASSAGGAAGAGGGALRCLGAVDLEAWPASSTPISVPEFACCRAYADGLAASLGDAGLTSAGGAVSADPSFANCCKAVLAAVDQHVPTSQDAWSDAALRACCYNPTMSEQEQLWDHAFCTPWGPPVPPALDPVLQDAA